MVGELYPLKITGQPLSNRMSISMYNSVIQIEVPDRAEKGRIGLRYYFSANMSHVEQL